ncbi:Protein white [Orchesella cincta]|uniref:Protein white n=1 Tax=Orchesella cincta TaxID=48709 RepID=A0A1D2MZ56_ORCCI|nr:Protein white [Orchesella cincta]
MSVKRQTVQGQVADDNPGHDNQGFDYSQSDLPNAANSGRRFTSTKSGSIHLNQVYYTWNDINAVAKVEKESFKLPCFGKKSDIPPKEPKQILKNVSGIARAGEILAIMGASGAGKTSLLNILTFRNTSSLNISGTRMVNGVPIDAVQLTLISAYIQQDDIFIGTLTPREHLRFQALLRMDKEFSYKERMRKVDEVIKEMGLTGCADTIIGIPGRIKGLSGGQQKRLSVASEVLTDPQLLICDEPTTGLDSFMAANLVKTLKSLANKGKTIICTIHQPASDTFAMFDKLLLMSEGRVAYYGDAKKAPTYFSSIGYPCPETYNPADFYIHTLAIRVDNAEECLQRSKAICDKYDESDNAKALKATAFSKDDELSKALKEVAKKRQKSPYKASWFAQFRACFWRSSITVRKDPLVLKVQLIQTIFLSLVIGLIYFGQENDQESIQNISGCIFMIIANLTFSSIFPVTNVFWSELPVFMREHFNGMYRTDTYYLAKTFAELPVYLILPAIFISISYWMVGLNDDIDRFFIAVGTAVLVANVGSSFGYMASTVTPSFETTMALAPVMITPFMLFGGSFLNKDSIPVYFIWLKYLSWFLYGNEALSINQWKGIKNITCEEGLACIEDGNQVLDSLSFKEDNFGMSLACLGGLIVVTRLISYGGLVMKSRRSK